MIALTEKLVSAEFVEVNPIIDNNNTTAKTAVINGILIGRMVNIKLILFTQSGKIYRKITYPPSDYFNSKETYMDTRIKLADDARTLFLQRPKGERVLISYDGDSAKPLVKQIIKEVSRAAAIHT